MPYVEVLAYEHVFYSMKGIDTKRPSLNDEDVEHEQILNLMKNG